MFLKFSGRNIRRKENKLLYSQKKSSLVMEVSREVLNPAVEWLLGDAYINSLRFWSREPLSETSSNLRRITWIFLGKKGENQRSGRRCVLNGPSPGATPEGLLLPLPVQQLILYGTLVKYVPFLLLSNQEYHRTAERAQVSQGCWELVLPATPFRAR